MGILDWLFGRDRGGGGNTKEEKQQQAIATLRKQLNKLDQQSKKLHRQSEEQKALAKQMLKSGNKTGAKQALTRSNIYMQKYNKMQNTQLNLQTQIDTISEATATVEVIDAMKVGTEVVSGVLAEVDAMDVEATMVAMEEQRDQLDLMGEALADTTSIEMGLEGDFADSIDDQLAAMELEIQGDLPDAGTKVETPVETESEPVKEKAGPSELEKELEALKNELDSD
ncbi:MAG: Snf7 family protein [Candidatus Kariarchaeaceae archaeon]|jgi:charged multivesicular body protein 6